MQDFEMVTIPEGDFTYGQNDEIHNISYSYQLMKYEVTNEQFVTYLNEALAQGKITVSEDGYRVRGFILIRINFTNPLSTLC